MASKKQIAANRRNAQKSTGPRSEEGKARSSQNAFKHGLTSRTVCLAEEDEEQYMEVRILLAEELRPLGALETMVVNRIAAQMWRVSRVPGIEAEIFDRLRYDGLGMDEGLAGAWLRDGSPYEGSLARLSRYETALERSISRLLKELRHLQADRGKRDAQDEARRPAGMRNQPNTNTADGDEGNGAVSDAEIRALENATGHPIGPDITPAQFRNLARLVMERGGGGQDGADLAGGGQPGIEGYGNGTRTDAWPGV